MADDGLPFDGDADADAFGADADGAVGAGGAEGAGGADDVASNASTLYEPLPPPTFVLQGVLWHTPEDKTSLDNAMVAVWELVQRRLGCWLQLSPQYTVEGMVLAGWNDFVTSDGACADPPGAESAPGRTACLLFLVYACRMGNASINLHRLMDVAQSTPPTQLEDARSSVRFQRLGLNDRRLLRLLGTNDANVDAGGRSVRSLYYETVTTLAESVLLHEWTRAVAHTHSGLAFYNPVVRLCQAYACQPARLHRELYKWYRCVRSIVPRRVRPPACEVAEDAWCLGDAARRRPIAVMARRAAQSTGADAADPRDQARGDVKALCLELRRYADGEATPGGPDTVEGDLDPTHRGMWDSDLQAELVHGALSRAWAVVPDYRDNAAFQRLRAYQHATLGVPHPDPDRPVVEACMLGMTHILDAWVDGFAVRRTGARPGGGGLLRYMTRLLFGAPAAAAPDADAADDAEVLRDLEGLVEALQEVLSARGAAAGHGDVVATLRTIVEGVLTTSLAHYQHVQRLRAPQRWLDGGGATSSALLLLRRQRLDALYRALDAVHVATVDRDALLRVWQRACHVGLVIVLTENPGVRLQHLALAELAEWAKGVQTPTGNRARPTARDHHLRGLLRAVDWTLSGLRAYVNLPVGSRERDVVAVRSTAVLDDLLNLRGTVQFQSTCEGADALVKRLRECRDDDAIVETVRAYLREVRYGDAQYVTESFAKRRRELGRAWD